jgi:hypothetical protein
VGLRVSIEMRGEGGSGRSWQDVHRKLLRDRARFAARRQTTPDAPSSAPAAPAPAATAKRRRVAEEAAGETLARPLAELVRSAGEAVVRDGWVYVVPSVRLIEGRRYCKIGFSADPDERFKSLCTNNPHALDLLNARAFRGNLGHEASLKILTAAHSTDAANEWRALPPATFDLVAAALPRYRWRDQPF